MDKSPMYLGKRKEANVSGNLCMSRIIQGDKCWQGD